MAKCLHKFIRAMNISEERIVPQTSVPSLEKEICRIGRVWPVLSRGERLGDTTHWFMVTQPYFSPFLSGHWGILPDLLYQALSVVTFFQPVLALLVPGPTLLLCDSGLSLHWFKPVLRLQGQNSFHVLTLAAHMLKTLFTMSFSFFTFIILPVYNGVF